MKLVLCIVTTPMSVCFYRSCDTQVDRRWPSRVTLFSYRLAGSPYRRGEERRGDTKSHQDCSLYATISPWWMKTLQLSHVSSMPGSHDLPRQTDKRVITSSSVQPSMYLLIFWCELHKIGDIHPSISCFFSYLTFLFNIMVLDIKIMVLTASKTVFETSLALNQS